jgi:predicted glycosyltransferase
MFGVDMDLSRSKGDNRPRRPRIALYSHDTVGLGHLRRNLLIAQTLACSELQATSLMITGAHETNFFALPAGVDCLTLPRLCKDGQAVYAPAKLDMSLDDVTQLREETICAALVQFEPDVLIVDKVPIGACGELLPALSSLAHRGRTHCILGLRDVLDDSDVVRAEWLSQQNIQAIEDFYDAIWIYGDPHIYNAVREYRFPKSLSKMARFTGYLDQTSRITRDLADSWLSSNSVKPPEGKYILCAVGGGHDGAQLVEAFIDAMSPDEQAVVLTGPYYSPSQMRPSSRATAVQKNIQIISFTPEADFYIAGADRVVSMAGYNTVCSILSFGRPALLVPRLSPRREQWIRAERFGERKLIDILSPEQLTPMKLAGWLMRPIKSSSRARELVDLNGLDRIVDWVGCLLTGTEIRSEVASATMLQTSCGN